jgi:hypothetical protein
LLQSCFKFYQNLKGHYLRDGNFVLYLAIDESDLESNLWLYYARQSKGFVILNKLKLGMAAKVKHSGQSWE